MTAHDSLKTINEQSGRKMLTDPDCIRCLRKKIGALGVVVFFREGAEWRIGNFESDIPREAAEAQFNFMLRSGVPELVASKGKGLLLIGDRDIESQLPALAAFFAGNSVVGSAVNVAGAGGVRVAWREGANPFSADDLKTLRCFSECPEGCGPRCAE